MKSNIYVIGLMRGFNRLIFVRCLREYVAHLKWAFVKKKKKMEWELVGSDVERRAVLCGWNVWKLEVRLKRTSSEHLLLEGQGGTRREILGQIAETVVMLLWNFLPPFLKAWGNEEALMSQAPCTRYRNGRCVWDNTEIDPINWTLVKPKALLKKWIQVGRQKAVRKRIKILAIWLFLEGFFLVLVVSNIWKLPEFIICHLKQNSVYRETFYAFSWAFGEMETL